MLKRLEAFFKIVAKKAIRFDTIYNHLFPFDMN